MKKKKETASMDDLISISQAARERGVTHGAIQDLIARGRLSVVEIAGRRLLRLGDVKNFKPAAPAGRGRKAGK